MYVILGAGGHIGSAAATALLDAGEPVTAVLHDPAKCAEWERRGARAVALDVRDVEALHAVFRTGERALLLNPPADVAGDRDTAERETARAIVAALDGTALDFVVAVSAYGAQPGPHCGDLGVLHDMEQALAAQLIPAGIQRNAYYMSNWDAQIDTARGGTLETMIPTDVSLPMVDPADLGLIAASRLRGEPDRAICFAEGPSRYSPRDVAAAFAKALGRKVEVREIPHDRWIDSYRKLGFSRAAAESFANMTAVSVEGGFDVPDYPQRGTTTLQAYIDRLVART